MSKSIKDFSILWFPISSLFIDVNGSSTNDHVEVVTTYTRLQMVNQIQYHSLI